MGWLSDRLRHRRPRHATPAVASQPASSESPAKAQRSEESTAPSPASVSQHGSREPEATKSTTDVTPTDGSSPWTAAYNEAIGQLDEDMRALVSKGRDLDDLFDVLNETNDAHKKHSILRKGMERIQTPIKLLDMAIGAVSPFVVDPTASAAFGIVRGVTTLAIGVCGMEESLSAQITKMLEQINIIDECDALGQKLDNGAAIHVTLVLVYKDLLTFYYAVVHLLTKKSVALAFISEQFNQHLPPVVESFLRHADQLHIHIRNATSEIVKSIESLLIEGKIQQLLGGQKLDRLDEYHIALTKKTAQDACEWVKNDSKFCTWYSAATNQPLVLFGDMGSGKTVVMSFIINHIRRLSNAQIPSALICYHYCRDDETGSSLYIYSSLIQQLMRQKPQFKVQFNRWCDEQQSNGNHAPTQDLSLLRSFFFDSASTLERPLIVFLDGLDECNDESCEELVTSFQGHSSAIPGLRFCASSRYQEEIRNLFEGSLQMRMQQEPQRDAIIVSHMVTERLSFLSQEGKDLVTERLSELARGSAIWVQMAVDLLAIRKIRAPAKLRAFLRDELPESKLSDLYAKLFSQATDGDEDNERVLSDALEILAVSARSLSVLELGWAVALRDPEASVATVAELKDYVDTKRVLGLLNPFIAGIDFEAQKARQFSLVHHSIEELVYQTQPRQWAQLRSSAPVSEATVMERKSKLDGELARLCVRYLLMHDLEDIELLPEEADRAQAFDEMGGFGFGAFDESDDDSGGTECAVNIESENTSDLSFDPSDRGFGELFTYASCYWPHHLRKAEHAGGPALSDVLALAKSQTKRSQNWWEQFHRPDCTLQRDKSESRPQELSPLTIVALYGPGSMLLEYLHEIDMEGRSPENVTREHLDAADLILRHGDLTRFLVLMRYDNRENFQSIMNTFCQAFQAWSEERHHRDMEYQKRFDMIFDRMTEFFDEMVEQKWANEMLCLAASHGCLPFITRLFAAAAHNPDLKRAILQAPDREDGHQSVGDAAWNGNADIVAFLLEQDGIDAHLQYRDAKGDNVLHKACRGSDAKTFELLLSRFPDGANQKNKSGDTPLRLIVFGRTPNSTDLARLSLEVGHADVRCGFTEQPSDWYEPIRMATRYGDLAMCQVLVRVGGADPMSIFKTGQDGQPEFIDAVSERVEVTLVRDCLLQLEEERKTQRVEA